MRAAAEVAAFVAVEVVFTAAVSAAAACMLEGFMAEAIAMSEVYGPHIQ
jgi:hypothetical protein